MTVSLYSDGPVNSPDNNINVTQFGLYSEAAPEFNPSDINVTQYGWGADDIRGITLIQDYINKAQAIYQDILDAEGLLKVILDDAKEIEVFYREIKTIQEDISKKYPVIVDNYDKIVKIGSDVAASATAAAGSAKVSSDKVIEAQQLLTQMQGINTTIQGVLTNVNSRYNEIVALRDEVRTMNTESKKLVDDLRKGQVYRGTWNPHSGAWPDPQGTNAAWDVTLNPKEASFDWNNIKWLPGDRLLYILNEARYEQVESGVGVLSVNGKSGYVILAPSDIGAYTQAEVDGKVTPKFDKAGGTLTGSVTGPSFTQTGAQGTTGTSLTRKDYVDTLAGTKVDKTTTVNGKPLSGSISITSADVGAVSSISKINGKGFVNNALTLTPADIGAMPVDGDASSALYLKRLDTRSDDKTPANLRDGLSQEFKLNSLDGFQGAGTYHAVLSIKQWSDSSGGLAKQLAFGDNGKIGLRLGSSDYNGWGAWSMLYSEANKPTALDIGATPRSGWGEALLTNIGDCNLIKNPGIYEYNADSGDKNGPASYGTVTVYAQANNSVAYNGWTHQAFRDSTGGFFTRYSTAPNGTTWSPWERVYTTGNKPTALDVGARASTWVPGWGDVTGKPTSFTPAAHKHPWADVTGAPVQTTRWPTAAEAGALPANGISLNDTALGVKVGANTLAMEIDSVSNKGYISKDFRYRVAEFSDQGVNVTQGVLSENGARVYSANNKPTAADVKARPDTWTPTTLPLVAKDDANIMSAVGYTGFSNTAAAKNFPKGVIGSGYEIVVGQADGKTLDSSMLQMWSPNDSNEIYLRTGDGSATGWVFRAWERLYTASNKPTSADVGAVAKSGDTMTGKLVVPSFTDRLTGIGENILPYKILGANDWGGVVGQTSFVQPSSIGAPAGTSGGYWSVLGKRDSNNGYAGIYIPYAHSDNRILIGRNEAGSNTPTWTKIYTEINKPTAVDVGALPNTTTLGDLGGLPKEVGAISPTIDINTLQDPGRYNIPAASPNWAFPGSGGILDVYVHGKGSFVRQVAFSGGSNQISVRALVGTSWSMWASVYTSADKPSLDDLGALAKRTRLDWVNSGVREAVVGQLAWNNYGNQHTVFDVSAGTSPDGTLVDKVNAAVPWMSSYPTLVGWNGGQTFGVRVDSARIADTAADAVKKTTTVNGKPLSGNITLTAADVKALPDTLDASKEQVINAPGGVVAGRYYPILFTNTHNKEDILVSNGSFGGDHAMNNCSFRGRVRSGGWSDKTSFVDGVFTAYDMGERAIHSIHGGTEGDGFFVVYVEGRAFPITVIAKNDVVVSTSATSVSAGTSVFTASADPGSGNTKTKMLMNFNRGTGHYTVGLKLDGGSFLESDGGSLRSNTAQVMSLDGKVYSFVTSPQDAHLCYNSYWDGANWLKYDNARNSGHVVTNATGLRYITSAAGQTNPITNNYAIYHEGNKPTPAAIGAQSLSDTRSNSMNNVQTTIPATEGGDMNAQIAGYYGLYNGNKVANSPFAGYFYAETKSIYADGALLQTAWPYDGLGGVFHRNYSLNSKSWTPWRSVYDTGSKPTPASIGAMAATPPAVSIASATPSMELHKPGVIAAMYNIDSSNRWALSQTGGNSISNYTHSLVDITTGQNYFNAQRWTNSMGHSYAGQWSQWSPLTVDFGTGVGANDYYPIVKGRHVITGQGYTTDVEFGMIRSGNTWGGAVIRVGSAESGTAGTMATYNFDIGGNFTASGKVSGSTGNFTSATIGNGGVNTIGNVVINNVSPTLWLQDTDNRSAAIHNNSNLLYILRGQGNNAIAWDGGPNGRHPMTLNLETGDVVFSGNVVAYSDRRLKKDIKPLENALEKIMKLKGVSYKRTGEDTDRLECGFVAQDLQEVIPEVVIEQQDEDKILTVDYAKMNAYLVEAIKEQQRLIEDLQIQVKELRGGE